MHWRGQLSPADIPSLIVRADVLVLPSRKDGWGAVVNEALMLGTPVVCSAASGSCDLIRQEWVGTVVPAGDVTALHLAIDSWARRGRLTRAARQRIRDWSQCINSASIAKYLETILVHVYDAGPRAVAPWRRE